MGLPIHEHKFRVYRTGGWRYGIRPCEGAVQEGRDWFIQIESLADLMDLIEKEGQIVLNLDTIEIYDDRRE